ncbi:MAG: hypothetical protein MJ197_04135 [Bacteroidales bacterium]|nr:hypothetical protein [Bacteroidales bacterium]
MKTRVNKNAKHLLTIGACFAIMIGALNLYLANVVTVSADMPETMQYGSSVPVTITIEKGNIDGFGRFSCTLPKEFTATSNDQNFSFENNTVTLIWVMLPESDDFSFTFNINVPDKAKSSFTLTGKFGYVQDNEKHYAELAPRTIKLKENTGAIASSAEKVRYNDITCSRTIEFMGNEAIVSITTDRANASSMCKIEEMLPAGFTAKAMETQGSEVSTIQNVARFMWTNAPATENFTITYKVIAEKGYNINDLFINGAFSVYDNGATKSFVISDNYNGVSESTATTASNADNHPIIIADGANNGYYSSADVLKTISNKNYTASQAQFFSNTAALNTIYQPSFEEIAQFSEESIPTQATEDKEYEISQTTETTTTNEIVSTKSNPELINNILSQGKAVRPTISTIEAEQNQITQTTTQKTTQITTTTTTITPVVKQDNKAQEDKKLEVKSAPATKTAVATTAPKSNAKNATLSNKNNLAQKETKVSSNASNVSYRVQVAASHRPIKNTQSFFAKRNVHDAINSEKIDTWYKYTIKNFDTYVNARNLRNAVWEQTPIKGAFVVAYNGKKRITVQEALMLTNQKWVK